jgi:hypothetical protein
MQTRFEMSIFFQRCAVKSMSFALWAIGWYHALLQLRLVRSLIRWYADVRKRVLDDSVVKLVRYTYPYSAGGDVVVDRSSMLSVLWAYALARAGRPPSRALDMPYDDGRLASDREDGPPHVYYEVTYVKDGCESTFFARPSVLRAPFIFERIARRPWPFKIMYVDASDGVGDLTAFMQRFTRSFGPENAFTLQEALLFVFLKRAIARRNTRCAYSTLGHSNVQLEVYVEDDMQIHERVYKDDDIIDLTVDHRLASSKSCSTATATTLAAGDATTAETDAKKLC